MEPALGGPCESLGSSLGPVQGQRAGPAAPPLHVYLSFPSPGVDAGPPPSGAKTVLSVCLCQAWTQGGEGLWPGWSCERWWLGVVGQAQGETELGPGTGCIQTPGRAGLGLPSAASGSRHAVLQGLSLCMPGRGSLPARPCRELSAAPSPSRRLPPPTGLGAGDTLRCAHLGARTCGS